MGGGATAARNVVRIGREKCTGASSSTCFLFNEVAR